MKEISKVTVISLFILLIISHTSARLLPTHPDDNYTEIKLDEKSSVEEDFTSLMGIEECGEKDDECLKRRMTAEANLDYIYTQRHKNP